MPIEPSNWIRIIESNPEHTQRYIERFHRMAAQGHDLGGEARFVDAMAERESTILDAGCGPGRVGGRLHARGHHVIGVDVDPGLIEAAEKDYPGPTWAVQDLAALDLESLGTSTVDIIVCAGNVMTFLAPSTRQLVLDNFAAALGAEGRAVIGFGAGRGYDFNEFFGQVAQAGLTVDLALSSWDMRPFSPGSEFLVAVLSKPAVTQVLGL
ncbi:MAG: class I SAM-dependent methyltransferase [Flaviflexus sp.]|nr:class I SAM-dependent methyltransferase [Flaviflexus sp.]